MTAEKIPVSTSEPLTSKERLRAEIRRILDECSLEEIRGALKSLWESSSDETSELPESLRDPITVLERGRMLNFLLRQRNAAWEALHAIKAGPPTTLGNDEVASWAAIEAAAGLIPYDEPFARPVSSCQHEEVTLFCRHCGIDFPRAALKASEHRTSASENQS
jgi:hypothetical protein